MALPEEFKIPILSLSAGLPSTDEKLSSFSQPEATIVCLPTSVPPPCDSFKFSMLVLFGTNGMTTS